MFNLRTGVLAATLTASILVSGSAMAQSDPKITKTENMLLAAGFTSRPATTPDRAAMLARLPREKFVRRVKGEKVAYVYADPKHCNCLYVGSQQAYGKYRATQQAANIASDQRWAAQDYSDARWNWGAWGPWGGYWAPYGFGHHRGW